ncbi:MAG: Fe-S cluster assembly protein SufD [Muribaculaceae bacterium]|nr:Fe-S cluster assembly protein SufD [Muribaculaceae bacterium]
MSALSQYIELFDSHRATIEAKSAEVMNLCRQDARNRLEGKRLPQKGTEGYEKTSIEDMFAPDFGVNINRVNIPVDVSLSFKCDVPNMSTIMAFVVNDSFVPSSTLHNKMPQGVIIDSLAKVATENPQLVSRYYNQLADNDNEAVALNTMLAQDGVMIYVPRGVVMERPIQLVNIFNSAAPLMGVRRLVIVVEEGAKAQLLICDHTQNSEYRYLSSQVIEAFVGQNASLDIYDIEESSDTTSRYSQLYARQERDSQLIVNGVTLTGGVTRNDYHIELVGDNCTSTLGGMAIGSGHQHIDNNSDVRHLSAHCNSNQQFKYVLDEESTGAFEGAIYVAPGAQFTEAYQSNRNLLASKSARMHTKPQLEIYNDDVKCSHGATTGQLDADALFYMRSRGIPEQEARTMLMQAFMVDVIDMVKMEGLRDRLRHLVEKRFYGQQASCADCGVTCRDPKKD